MFNRKILYAYRNLTEGVTLDNDGFPDLPELLDELGDLVGLARMEAIMAMNQLVEGKLERASPCATLVQQPGGKIVQFGVHRPVGEHGSARLTQGLQLGPGYARYSLGAGKGVVIHRISGELNSTPTRMCPNTGTWKPFFLEEGDGPEYSGFRGQEKFEPSYGAVAYSYEGVFYGPNGDTWQGEQMDLL
jgi:hypothetical protein